MLIWKMAVKTAVCK